MQTLIDQIMPPAALDAGVVANPITEVTGAQATHLMLFGENYPQCHAL